MGRVRDAQQAKSPGLEFLPAHIRAFAASMNPDNFRNTGRQTVPRFSKARWIMDDEIARAQRARKDSPFLNTQQAAFYLGLSARKLQQMRRGDTGPVFRCHSRHVRYHIDDLDAWSKSATRGSSRDA